MDRDRFIQLVSTEQVSLKRYLLGLCRGNAEEADDLFQDAMTRAYLASPSMLERARPGAWLLKICYHCFVDRTRSRKTDSLEDSMEFAERLQEEQHSDDVFRYETLYEAICHLPEKERSSIMLFYLEDRSIREISHIMDIPSGSVKGYLFRGRQKLKELLKNEI
ncbi:MAG: RNA polymerase sigma factor [Bacteroidales bacterium]|nr:RNA polymerase sigma factor [Bacteroidales bacterium]